MDNIRQTEQQQVISTMVNWARGYADTDTLERSVTNYMKKYADNKVNGNSLENRAQIRWACASALLAFSIKQLARKPFIRLYYKMHDIAYSEWDNNHA